MLRHLLAGVTLLAPGGAAAQEPALGRIDFPTSGAAAAQPSFIRGVLYLHSFEYERAARAFREAQRLDPGFAMAYWGEAMTYTHPIWLVQDVAAARAALQRLARTPELRRQKAPTRREQRYLDAVEILYGDGGKETRDTLFSREMERISAEFPSDDEARSFFALSLLGLLQHGRDTPTYMRAASLMEEVFARNPQHPGAVHYLIHAYDDPVHAPLGLRAARVYGSIASGAGHALHMTSHIFVAMGMWDDVISSNIDAWKTVERGGHYTQWLSYGYLQQGRFAEAERHVRDIMAATRTDATTYNVGYRNLMLAAWVIETEQWDSPLARFAEDSVSARERAGGGVAATDALRFTTAWARLRRANTATLPAALRHADSARTAMADRVRAERNTGGGRYVPWLGPTDVMTELLGAAVWQARGVPDSAIAAARRGAEKDATYPFEFGPPESVKPPLEFLGELLLAEGRAAEARGAFEQALRRTPNRSRSVLGLARALAAAGDRTRAAAEYARFRANWKGAPGTAPELAEAQAFVSGAR